MEKIIFSQESYKIVGACFDVYKNLGCGFLEAVYQECLEIEFTKRKIPFESQREIQLNYKGVILKQTFRADFICFGKIILEIKAVSNLSSEHEAQILNYLNATGLNLGLLINFGHYPKIEYKRFLL